MAPFEPQRLVIQRFGDNEACVARTPTATKKPKPSWAQDILFLYDVPTEWDWDEAADERGDRIRKPARQLSKKVSADYTRVQTLMLTASDLLSVFEEADECDDEGNGDCHAQLVHRLQAWRADSYQNEQGEQDPIDLKRLIVLADDDPGTLQKLKDGKVALEGVFFEDASWYWAKDWVNTATKDTPGSWRYDLKDDDLVRDWGKSLHTVLRQWVGHYLEGHRHWKQMLSDENGAAAASGVAWSSIYPMVDLPGLWFARLKLRK